MADRYAGQPERVSKRCHYSHACLTSYTQRHCIFPNIPRSLTYSTELMAIPFNFMKFVNPLNVTLNAISLLFQLQ